VLGRNEDRVHFAVADDSAGFDPAGACLVRIADRLAALGGSLSVESPARLTAEIPLERSAG